MSKKSEYEIYMKACPPDDSIGRKSMGILPRKTVARKWYPTVPSVKLMKELFNSFDELNNIKVENIDEFVNKLNFTNILLIVNYQPIETPIHIAAKIGRVDLLQALCFSYPNLIEFKSPSGWTPLMWAVKYQQIEAVKCLLNLRANINATDWKGESALHLAVYNGDEGCVRLLLDKGIEVKKNDRCYAAIDEIAESLGNTQIIEIIEKYAFKSCDDHESYEPQLTGQIQ